MDTILLEDLELLLREINEFCGSSTADEVPPSVENYLHFVAKTGNTIFPWQHVRPLFKHRLNSAIGQFHGEISAVEPCVYERFDLFRSAPFTIQRIAELVLQPQKHYKTKDKFVCALEKTVYVVSTVEPTTLYADDLSNGIEEDLDNKKSEALDNSSIDIEPDASSVALLDSHSHDIAELDSTDLLRSTSEDISDVTPACLTEPAVEHIPEVDPISSVEPKSPYADDLCSGTAEDLDNKNYVVSFIAEALDNSSNNLESDAPSVALLDSNSHDIAELASTDLLRSTSEDISADVIPASACLTEPTSEHIPEVVPINTLDTDTAEVASTSEEQLDCK